MNKKDVYRFWAVFHYAKEGVSVTFPDLPGCNTFGDTAEEAHAAAREALEGFLYLMEIDHDPIPNPSPLDTILPQLENDEALCDVKVYLPTVRAAMASKAVKKTVTVPKWLNDEAEKQRLNFSHILQEGLKKSLGVDMSKAK